MNAKLIPLEYVNDLMYELQKSFWDERGRGARFRMTTVGREFYNEKVAPLLKDADLDAILATVREVLLKEGIVSDIVFLRPIRSPRVPKANIRLANTRA